jgi:hypothetical protein
MTSIDDDRLRNVSGGAGRQRSAPTFCDALNGIPEGDRERLDWSLGIAKCGWDLEKANQALRGKDPALTPLELEMGRSSIVVPVQAHRRGRGR